MMAPSQHLSPDDTQPVDVSALLLEFQLRCLCCSRKKSVCLCNVHHVTVRDDAGQTHDRRYCSTHKCYA